jgi:membrane protein DedA with SNARE-associated domain
MLTQIINVLTNFIVSTISSMGYAGVAGLMAIESAAIPLPSEIIMPFAGYVASTGRFSVLGIALAGAIGSVIGSFITYEIGAVGGRKLVTKYGKYVLISNHDLELADKFFAKYGLFAALIGRVLPVVRTFISIPAGISKAKRIPFLFYSFVGSFVWSYILGYAGYKLGPAWLSFREKAHWFDTTIIILIVIGIVWWVWRHIKNKSQ